MKGPARLGSTTTGTRARRVSGAAVAPRRATYSVYPDATKAAVCVLCLLLLDGAAADGGGGARQAEHNPATRTSSRRRSLLTSAGDGITTASSGPSSNHRSADPDLHVTTTNKNNENNTSSSTRETKDERDQDRPLELPIPLPANPRCPWLSEGVAGAARRSPLVRAMVRRTRLAAPFGPGSWPQPFRPSGDTSDDGKSKRREKNDSRGEARGGPREFGWKGAVVLSATVRIDKRAAAEWLPKSLLRVAGDTAEVFIAW